MGVGEHGHLNGVVHDKTIADVQITVNGITNDRSPTVTLDDVKGQIDHKN